MAKWPVIPEECKVCCKESEPGAPKGAVGTAKALWQGLTSSPCHSLPGQWILILMVEEVD